MKLNANAVVDTSKMEIGAVHLILLINNFMTFIRYIAIRITCYTVPNKEI